MEDEITFPIGGIQLRFPFKPYPSQKAMMAHIIKGLTKRQNCLLESPTGSGKSLALLCSTLGWLEAEEDKVRRFNSLIDQGISDPDILSQVLGNSGYIQSELLHQHQLPSRTSPVIDNSNLDNPPDSFAQNGGNIQMPSDFAPRALLGAGRNSAPETTSADVQGNLNSSVGADKVRPDSSDETLLDGGFIRGSTTNTDGDFREFKPTTLKMRVRDESGNITTSNVDESFLGQNETLDQSLIGPSTPHIPTVVPQKLRVPVIYFGTRTHKQIYQITKELRRSGYRSVRSAVLASREHTCIHPIVSMNANKNEECKNLRDGKNRSLDQQDWGCMFHDGVQRMRSHDQIKEHGIQPAWDVEDLVKLGRKLKACPYYSSRFLRETAQIIICPYNYLIDPLIRESMQISLKNNIVVLDEAHNVEDCSREAASFSVSIDHMVDARDDLEKLKSKDVHPISCDPLIEMLSNLCMWMHSYSEKLTDYTDYGKTGKIISGHDMLTHLNHMDIKPNVLESLQDSVSTLNEEPPNENDVVPKPTAATNQLVKGLLLMFHFLFKENCRYAQDYQIALVRTQIFTKRGISQGANGFFGKKKGPTASHVYLLNFWCLNPGVTFSSLGEIARCVILTSGTLSPMDTFESELQVHFPIRLEANHVINNKQVWVGTVSSGPTNIPLNATFKHAETWAFQDELGRMVVDVCESVPRGVLCFFPSYSMLEKLVERWQTSSLWDQILLKKMIIIEPRRSNEFEDAMKSFYDTIQDTKNCDENSVNGALFMAVCRGKVSEGLDFTDDNARAVITVGIPFPNFKDIQVNLKRQYNDKFSKQRGLLPGSQWYEIQAYRALNQALGRCIRHRFDWGALILVDERYQKTSWGANAGDKYIKGLSKWVRKNLVHQPNFKLAIQGIKKFASNMVENPPQESVDASVLLDTTCSKPRFPTPPKFPVEGNETLLIKKENSVSPTMESPIRVTKSCDKSGLLDMDFKALTPIPKHYTCDPSSPSQIEGSIITEFPSFVSSTQKTDVIKDNPSVKEQLKDTNNFDYLCKKRRTSISPDIFCTSESQEKCLTTVSNVQAPQSITNRILSSDPVQDNSIFSPKSCSSVGKTKTKGRLSLNKTPKRKLEEQKSLISSKEMSPNENVSPEKLQSEELKDFTEDSFTPVRRRVKTNYRKQKGVQFED